MVFKIIFKKNIVQKMISFNKFMIKLLIKYMIDQIKAYVHLKMKINMKTSPFLKNHPISIILVKKLTINLQAKTCKVVSYNKICKLFKIRKLSVQIQINLNKITIKRKKK